MEVGLVGVGRRKQSHQERTFFFAVMEIQDKKKNVPDQLRPTSGIAPRPCS